MSATSCKTSSACKTLRGNTTANNLRTCEIVIAGAFFFQPALEMPQKEMGEHTREHMVMPTRILPDFIVVHPPLRFRFFEALFDGPPDSTEPDQQAQGDTHRGVAELVPVARLRAEGALAE